VIDGIHAAEHGLSGDHLIIRSMMISRADANINNGKQLDFQEAKKAGFKGNTERLWAAGGSWQRPVRPGERASAA